MAFSKAHSVTEEQAVIDWFAKIKEPDIFSINAFLEFYKARAITDKRYAFAAAVWLRKFLNTSSIQPNSISFNTIIAAYCGCNDFLSAGRWIHRMTRYGCMPDEISYSTIVVAAAKQNHNAIAAHFLNKMMADKLKLSIVPFSTVINAYSRQGDVASATAWLEKMKSVGIQPDTKLLQGFMTSQKRDESMSASSSTILPPDDAERWFERLQKTGCSPGLDAYTTVIVSHCNVGDLPSAHVWLDKMRIAQIAPKLHTFHKIIQTACKAPSLIQPVDVLYFFEYMKLCKIKPSTGQFNALLDLYAKKSDSQNGMILMEKMESEYQVLPDAINFKTALFLCGKTGEHGHAVRLFEKMQQRNITCNTDHYNHLLTALSKHEDSNACEEYFCKMPNPDLMSFTILINNFAKSKQTQKVLTYLQKLNSHPKYRPDLICYNACLDAFAKNADAAGAEKLFESMKQHGLVPDLVTFTILVDACASSNIPEKAIYYFEQMSKNGIRANTKSYLKIVSMYANNGDVEKAENFVQKMKDNNLKPNHAIYSALVSGYALQGDSNRIEECLQKISKDGIKPNLDILSAVIAAFSKSSLPEMAENWLIQKLPEYGVHPDRDCFNAVMAGTFFLRSRFFQKDV